MADGVIAHEDIPETLNLASWFLDRNVERGDGGRVALYADRPVTYDELARLTNRVGNALLDLDVRPDDRVLLALGDGPEFVASWFGALKIGAVVAEVYTFLREKDYRYYLEYGRPRVVIVDASTVETIERASSGIQYPPRLLVVGDTFDAAVASASDRLEPFPTGRDGVALWKFTTGSTGAPKAVCHLAHDPVVSFENFAVDVVGYRAEDVVLPVPKLFFGYARDATCLFTFGVGAAGVVFRERSTPELLFDLIERHRPTIMVQVPTMMRAMLDAPGAGERDLSSLRLCLSSGEALPADVHRRWLDTYGVEVLEGIGSSELYHIYISNRPGRVRPGSVGELVPGYEARLLDADGEPVPEGEPGELWAGGESAGVLYWGDHVRSKRTFHGDLVRTGDLFVRDRDGFFWYRGRADDLLKVGGIWVAPLEIENCLDRHPAVAECLVGGIEDEGLVVPCAWVVLRDGDGSDDLAAALQAYVRQELSPHKYPRVVRFVDDLPKTATGKLDRKALRAEVVAE
ncbi:MAG TPA: benzoate-CoA ligase family protein [Gaiellaceae bacterium]